MEEVIEVSLTENQLDLLLYSLNGVLQSAPHYTYKSLKEIMNIFNREKANLAIARLNIEKLFEAPYEKNIKEG